MAENTFTSRLGIGEQVRVTVGQQGWTGPVTEVQFTESKVRYGIDPGGGCPMFIDSDYVGPAKA